MKNKIRLVAGISTIALLGTVSQLQAGPFILAGTDADEHGSFSGGTNQDGWLFMQRALENLAPAVTNGNKTVYILGSDTGTTAGNAAASAFNNSNLAGAGGWSSVVLNGDALTTFLQGGLVGAGIVMMDSGSNVSGGASAAERNAFTANAGNINTFLANGGGLFSQANGYGWVQALVPGLTVVSASATGLALTPDGSAAFPGLTNGDLSAGPWHNYFTNIGSIPVLATSTTFSGNPAVIIGASGGSVTNPDPPVTGVPDGGSFAFGYLLLAGLGFVSRRFAVKR